MCTKIKFSEKQDAKDELRRIIMRPRHKPWKDKVPKRVYWCGVCKSFHLTSQITVIDYE